MSQEPEPNESFVSVEKRLPEKHQRVIVICQKFRCQGYLDEKGVWRNHYSDEELKDVIAWAE